MDRRHASKLILAGGLAAPALIRPGSAWANQASDNPPRVAETGRLILQLAAARVTIELLMLSTASGWLGMSLAQQQRQFDENRLGVGGSLGGLFRPTFADRLQAARLVGSLYVIQNALIILPRTPLDLRGLDVTVYHRDISWDLAASVRAVSFALSSSEVRAATRAVGVAYLATSLLMLAVNPVLGRNYTG